ncbi:DUF6946 family protein [Mesorhizobium sp. 131-2-5]|uniref:DUF6946 family protein n=1 Tax=Mesorhizobium sp. 131-2-5 TaxID=2744519 RepID=UPI0018EAB8A5|nr:hypothetical protein [Mesorhizobium sp. 131-2-5]
MFALIRFGDQTCAATIKGKASEPFGLTVGEWYAEPSQGKRERMRQLCGLLGFDVPPFHIHYQLVHRTASALIEARRFKTDEAAMIVHSFSPAKIWFEDLTVFASLFGAKAKPDHSSTVIVRSGQRLRLRWATGKGIFSNAQRSMDTKATSPRTSGGVRSLKAHQEGGSNLEIGRHRERHRGYLFAARRATPRRDGQRLSQSLRCGFGH